MASKITAKFIGTVSVLALILAVHPVAFAADSTEKVSGKVQKDLVKSEQTQTAEKRQEIIAEATSAIRETQNALKALDEKKNKDALAALERAAGKLEIILARDRSLALAPVGVNAVTHDILSTIDAIQALRKSAEDALDDGRIQDARRLISNLASETVISVTNIPLATYPAAIKQAAKYIDDGKADEAKTVLQSALNMLVITDTIIPLPIVGAEHLLKEAEALAEKAQRSEDENKRLADLLQGAREKLQFAQALGYGSRRDLENLYGQLDQIAGKTASGKSGTGFFEKIKGYLKDAVQSSQAKQAKK